MGIHPGVASHDSSDAERLKAEISRMKELSNVPVQHARQHYLLQRVRLHGGAWKPLVFNMTTASGTPTTLDSVRECRALFARLMPLPTAC